MEVAAVIERVRVIAAARVGGVADRAELEAALRAEAQLRAWLSAANADIARRLATVVSFPEATIADCTRTSLNDALKNRERVATLDAVPAFADALDRGEVTAAHVDAITRAANTLEGDQRGELLARAGGLVDLAAVATVRDFGRRLDSEVNAIRRDDGIARFERQQRAARLRTWIDGDGMTCLSARLDPLTGVRVTTRLDAEVAALFAAAEPATCPSDPIAKQQHLQALAFANLIGGGGASDDRSSSGVAAAGRPGRPEYVVVIDTSSTDGSGGPVIDWGLPVAVPQRVLADLIAEGDGEIHTIVVRNGVVLHAPGETDLGRTTRLANRAQRRALRALYATCAIPGCDVRYDRCKLHHVVWWRHGGRTDLDNLLPVCTHHHTCIHDQGWHVVLGRNRQLTIRLPDGQVLTTGPPTRRAA